MGMNGFRMREAQNSDYQVEGRFNLQVKIEGLRASLLTNQETPSYSITVPEVRGILPVPPLFSPRPPEPLDHSLSEMSEMSRNRRRS